MMRPLLAMVSSVLLAAPAVAQAPDPTDPLAKPAPPVVVPAKEIQGYYPFFTFAAIEKAYPLPQDPATKAKVRGARLKNFLDQHLAVFEKHGNAKAPWANQVRAAITAYCWAYTRTASPRDGVYYQAFLKELDAVDPACDDPLIGYWRDRHLRESPFLAQFGSAKGLPLKRAATEKLVAAKVYPNLALHAVHNLRYEVRELYGRESPTVTEEDVRSVDALFDAALIAATAAAKPADWPSFLEIANLEMTLLGNAGMRRLDAWTLIDKRMEKLKSPGWLRDAFAGGVLVSAAWDARGSGTADTVTDEGAEVFQSRLIQAKARLEAAWKADPTLAAPATTMLTVAKGLGFPREEMELWFRRAMEADPDNRDACEAKKDWLHPKWYGSKNGEDVYGFVLQCLQSNNYYGMLPYLYELPQLRALPHHIPNDVREITRHPLYFSQFRNVAEGHLARYPDDKWARSRYAYHACLWKQWNVAHAQFELIGDKPWVGFFPRSGEFDEMKKAAKERAAP